MLDLLRERGRNAVRIDGVIVEPFRLEEDLVAVPLPETDDLVLDRRAIARAPAIDLAGIHRRTMDIRPDDGVGGLGGPGDAALDLRVLDPGGQGRERLRRLIARLHIQRGPVDGPAIETGRRAGLQAAEGKADPLQRLGKPHRRRLPDPAGRDLLLADMDQAAQEGAGGRNHGPGIQNPAVGETKASDAAVLARSDRRLPLR